MTEQEPGYGEHRGVADAVVETRGRPSIIWLIPLVAALVGAFVAWRAFSERGPEITIAFKSAEGLEAGKTQIKYKDVELGVVEGVHLAPDLSGVICRARMVAGAEKYLTETTRFWVVKPRIAGGQVTGLGTLLSGSYIGMDPILEGKRTRDFTGLEVQPVITTEEAGRYFVLRSNRAGTVDAGSPVYFRQIQVGQVVSSELDLKDNFVTTRIFVLAPYDERVHGDSRFWNASGINVSLGAEGLTVDTQSLVSILIGGIAFETPEHEQAEVAPAETVFPLYASRQAAEQRHFTRTVSWLLYFDQSVRGLTIGAPVEFRGILIGKVTDLSLKVDVERGQFLIPVTVEIEPERFISSHADAKASREFVDQYVASGLRAQLRTGNLLTGQLYVALDIFKDAKPAQVVWSGGPFPVFPTIPTPLEQIEANLVRLVDRISRLPVEQIGAGLQGSLQALHVTLSKTEDVGPVLKATLEEANRTLASANALIGPDSSVNSELRRTLLELSDAARALGLAADQIQTQPDSLLFGKKGSN